jgi:hypothetical protein
MRISADPDHADYHEGAHLCQVYLAGAERCNVLSADEAGRFAVTFRLDEFGNQIFNKAGELQRETFRGDVRIEAPEIIRLQRERLEAGEPPAPHPNLWPFP